MPRPDFRHPDIPVGHLCFWGCPAMLYPHRLRVGQACAIPDRVTVHQLYLVYTSLLDFLSEMQWSLMSQVYMFYYSDTEKTRSLSYAVRHERIDNDDGNSAFPTESNYDRSCLTFWWKQALLILQRMTSSEDDETADIPANPRSVSKKQTLLVYIM
ncbi:hypothetical protein E5288_WYG016671 [Bos mutus]|uniref:Uncharacterized protein n=1 Tax=Bos mutus TaxID=72004 RepID=A0A6B0R484_9CETA|nr:hypothetical protein [Bos mutus]